MAKADVIDLGLIPGLERSPGEGNGYLLQYSGLKNSMDWSPPGSSVHGILQVRILEWVAISFSRDLSQPGIEPVSSVPLALAGRFVTTELPGKPTIVLLLLLLSHFSRVRLCATPETAAHQDPLSLGFSRQEYWSGLSCPPPGESS